jgi:polyisoprenoid-binding protein YceI
MSTTQQQAVLPVGTWQIDPSHSTIGFSVKHMMIATVRGRFERFQGTLEVGDDGEVHVTGVIEAASIDTNEPQRDEHLRSADFFEVTTYPEISFQSTSVQPLGGRRLRIVGDLTIHGATREVVLEAEFLGAAADPWGNERLALEARGEVSRKDFGLTWNQALETGGVLVGDKIKIALDLSTVLAAQKAA